MVLLKNEQQLLPLQMAKLQRMLITGPAADAVVQGGGSGSVPAAVEVSPLQGLRNAFADKVEITHIPFAAPFRASGDAISNAAAPLETPKAKKKAKAPVRAVSPDSKKTTADLEVLARAAQSADVVVFVAAGMQASEGRDLSDMDLPGQQAEAIATLAKANRNVVVVLVNNGAVMLDPWLKRVPALLAIHYAGQATGDALADVLTGRVNPAGKLSYTFGKRLEDFPVHAVGEWPARLVLEKDPVNPGMKPEDRKATHAFSTDYKEGVFAGYRWFDEKRIEPAFPFGHGLSYTTFKLSGLSVTDTTNGIRVACTVRNTGDRAGSEVVQVYVAPPKSSVPRPLRELKGFVKVRLAPGESRKVEIALRPAALAFYAAAKKQWKAEAGEYAIQVGTSSRALPLRAGVTLNADGVYAHY
jgi:beta-glucosidase